MAKKINIGLAAAIALISPFLTATRGYSKAVSEKPESPYIQLFEDPLPSSRTAAELYQSARTIYSKNRLKEGEARVSKEGLLGIISALSGVIEIEPRYPNAHYILGWAIRNHGSWYGSLEGRKSEQLFKESSESFMRAVEINPRSRTMFGSLLHTSDASFSPQILKLCGRILISEPDNPVALQFCAEAQIDAGITELGLAKAEKALELSRDPMIRLQILSRTSGVLARTGNQKEAKQYAAREEALRKQYVEERRRGKAR